MQHLYLKFKLSCDLLPLNSQLWLLRVSNCSHWNPQEIFLCYCAGLHTLTPLLPALCQHSCSHGTWKLIWQKNKPNKNLVFYSSRPIPNEIKESDTGCLSFLLPRIINNLFFMLMIFMDKYLLLKRECNFEVLLKLFVYTRRYFKFCKVSIHLWNSLHHR